MAVEHARAHAIPKLWGVADLRPWSNARHDGNAIGGNMSLPANAAGFLIHSAVHKARPDVVAACHTHSPYGKAWSAFGRRLEMINQDVTYFYGEAQAVYEVSCYSFCSFLFKPGSPVKAWSYAILTRRTTGVQRCRLLRRRRRPPGRRPGAQRQRPDPAQPRLADRRRNRRRGLLPVHSDGEELSRAIAGRSRCREWTAESVRS